MYKFPLPFTGLILAIFALGNLLKPITLVHHGLFILGIILLVYISIQMLMNRKSLIDGLKHPLIASVLPTYSMAIIILSGYIKGIGIYLWYIGIALHILMIINYTIRFIFNFELKKIFPSIFIVYVGIVCGRVVSYNETISQIILIFGFVVYLPLLILVISRLKQFPLPQAAKPTIFIMAAPVSLCLAGYMGPGANHILAYSLLVFSQALYLFVVIKHGSLLKMAFAPSFAAFTFPLVITSIAFKKTTFILGLSFMQGFVLLETIIAVLVVTYVFAKYFIKDSKKSIQKIA